jgi:hypothetical protein
MKGINQSKVDKLVLPLLDENGGGKLPRGFIKELMLKVNCTRTAATTMTCRTRKTWRKSFKDKGIKRKRLFYDIETSMAIGWMWRAGYDQRISADQIIEPQRIICISYKWEGEDKVHTIEWDKGCDYELMRKFIDVINSSDEAIAHNGDRFDMKWLRTRALIHGFDFSPNIITTDTCKISRSRFNFHSNKLNDIAKQLKLGEKLETGLQLWLDIVFKNCKSSMAKMTAYCEQDVIVLEDVYNVIRPYAKHRVNHGVKNNGEMFGCPECGSDKVTYLRPRYTAAGTVKREMQCGCGTFYEINNRSYMLYFEHTHSHLYS